MSQTSHSVQFCDCFDLVFDFCLPSFRLFVSSLGQRHFVVVPPVPPLLTTWIVNGLGPPEGPPGVGAEAKARIPRNRSSSPEIENKVKKQVGKTQ